MGQVFRIDLKGQRGLRSYVCEGNISEAFLRGLAVIRRIEAEKNSIRCIARSNTSCPTVANHDFDPAA
jgi:hypothetical protein